MAFGCGKLMTHATTDSAVFAASLPVKLKARQSMSIFVEEEGRVTACVRVLIGLME